MTRYIYIDENYKNAYLHNSSAEQRITMNAVAIFMAAPETENEKGVGKRLIVKGISKKDYKDYTDGVRDGLFDQDKKDNPYVQWMEYITRSCSQGDTTLVKFDEEDNREDIEFFENIVNDGDVDISGLNNTYWLSHCLCDKSVDECKKLEQKYGISIIGTDQDLTKHEPDASFLTKGERYTWDELIGPKESNSIFILDQYIFHKDDMMRANIIKIIQQIICRQSKVEVTIYTHKNLCYNHDHETTCLAELKQEIETALEDINDSVAVNVFSTGIEYHDRLIITNNRYITIGGGFDALKPNPAPDGKYKSDKNTTLHIYSNPAISSRDWLRNEYYGYINAISKSYETFRRQALSEGISFPTSNRLIRPLEEIRG